MVTDILVFPEAEVLKHFLVVTDFYYMTFDYTWFARTVFRASSQV